MKAYTDINQSKRLEKILPIDSADLHWQYVEEDNRQLQWFCLPKDFSINQHNGVPAWSVTALLETIPYRLNDGSDFTIEKWEDGYLTTYGASCYKYGNELVDACYEMILKLHDLKLL